MRRIRREQTKVSISLNSICVIIILIGVLLIIITSVDIDNACWGWNHLFKNVVSSIGTTLVSAGLVSVVLEISDIKNSVSSAINKILQGEFSFKEYKNDKLVEANNKIALSRLKLDENNDDLQDSIYEFYEPKLLESVKSVYYKYHNAVFIITPMSESQLFKFNVECNYEIINRYKLPNMMRFKIKSYSTKKDKTEFKLLKFQVNGRDEECVPDIKKGEDSIYYNTKINLKYDFGENEVTKVCLKYEYYSPMYDVRQSYKVTLPCQQLEHKIYMLQDIENSDTQWKLEATAFSAYYINQKNIDDKVRVEQAVEDSIKIKVDNWMFPGTGYVTMYIKNTN